MVPSYACRIVTPTAVQSIITGRPSEKITFESAPSARHILTEHLSAADGGVEPTGVPH